MRTLLAAVLVAQALGVIVIPSAGIAEPITVAPVIQGWHQIPDTGAGWLGGTAPLYADTGRITIGAHTPGAFDGLNQVRLDDEIILYLVSGVRVWEVYSVAYVDVDDARYAGTQGSANGTMGVYLAQPEQVILTLITCSGDERVIVEARLQ